MKYRRVINNSLKYGSAKDIMAIGAVIVRIYERCFGLKAGSSHLSR